MAKPPEYIARIKETSASWKPPHLVQPEQMGKPAAGDALDANSNGESAENRWHITEAFSARSMAARSGLVTS